MTPEEEQRLKDNYAEIGRLHQELKRLQSLVENAKDTLNSVMRKNSELNLRLTDNREQFDKLLNDLWGILYPGQTDWEYPGQVYNHIRVEIERLHAELEQIKPLVDHALANYPQFNSERCVSALLKIRKVIEPEEKQP